MTIKLLKLDVKKSQEFYDIISKVKEVQLNDCYINTLTVASYLRANPKLAKEYKVVYGYMQGVSAKDKGFVDWQYRSYVRHAFLVDRKNRVVDVSFTHLTKIGLENTPPLYMSMKKYTLDEYFQIIEDALKIGQQAGQTNMDITLKGTIPNEVEFMKAMDDEGYLIVQYNNEDSTVELLVRKTKHTS